MLYLQDRGIEIAVEMGPQAVLRNLMRKSIPGIKAFSFDKVEDQQALRKDIEEENVTSKNSDVLNTP